MNAAVNEEAVAALETLYSGPSKARELARAREIFAFLRSNGQGAVLADVPMVNGKLLDLVALLETITKRGGVLRVQDKGLWNEVTGELGLESTSHTFFVISVHYKNFLYSYEQVLLSSRSRVNIDAGQQQQQQQQQQPQDVGPPLGRDKPLQQHADAGMPASSSSSSSSSSLQRHERYGQSERQRELESEEQQARQHQRHVEQMKQQQEQQQRRLLEQQARQHQRHVEQMKQQQQQQKQGLFQQQQARQEMMLKQQQQQQHARYQSGLYQAHQQQQQQQQSGYACQTGGNAYPSDGNYRSRLPSPGGGGIGGVGVSAAVPRADLPKALGSSSPAEVCEAVNTLTLETFGASEEELILDEVPGLLDAIFDLMDKLNPAVTQVGSLAATLFCRLPKGSSPTPALLLDAAFASIRDEGREGGGGLSDLFAKPGLPPAGRGEILLLLLNALRNASFMPSNERSIGHSARAVQHFVSICSAVDPEPEVFAASLGLFGRVAKHLDISGRRAAETDFEGCKWAEDSLNYLAPAHVRVVTMPSSKSNSPPSSSSPSLANVLLSPSALEYVSSLALVFPTLVALVDEEERSRVLAALAIVATLAQMDSNREAFDRVPDSFLDRLTELLSIPMLGCDVLAPKAVGSSADWLETSCRVLLPSVAGVDEEVRNTALEVMALLAGLSDTLRSRLGAAPGCIRTLTRLAIASAIGERVGHQGQRTAAATLTALSLAESNHMRIRSMLPDMLVAAARDPHAADLLINGLKAVFPAS